MRTQESLSKKFHGYHLLLSIAVSILLVNFFYRNQTLDIHLHDTYYVIAASHLFVFLFSVTVLFSLLCFITKRVLYSNFLTWVHTLVFVGGLASVLVAFARSQAAISSDVSMLNISRAYTFSTNTALFAMVGAALIISGFLLFFINLAAGRYKVKARS